MLFGEERRGIAVLAPLGVGPEVLGLGVPSGVVVGGEEMEPWGGVGPFAADPVLIAPTPADDPAAVDIDVR